MSLLQIYESEQTAEFRSFLESIKSNIDSYTKAKRTAQKERMMIIGSISEYKEAVPQRSSDHRFLSKAMESEGWSKDVIYQNTLAYKAYKHILAGHQDFHSVAHKASVSLLMEIGKSKKCPTYDLLMYLRRNKELPSVTAYKGWLGGYFDDKFLPIRQNTPKPKDTVAETTDIVPLEVLPHDPDPITQELVLVNESDFCDELVSLIKGCDLDQVYGDDEQRKKLEPIRNQLMALAHMAIPQPIKPTYV